MTNDPLTPLRDRAAEVGIDRAALETMERAEQADRDAIADLARRVAALENRLTELEQRT